MTNKVICPDYYSSLDAVHELEKKLSAATYTEKDSFEWSQRCEYMSQLERLVVRDSKVIQCNFEFYTATAAQRAEALLRTLGLWEE